MKLPAVPPSSQPRWGSTAPTVELLHGSNRARRHNPALTSTANPLWELSSFSEAAKAVGQPMKLPAEPPPSQPRWGSTAPTVELRHGSNRARRHNPAPTSTTDPLWELSSFSEAAKAVSQPMKRPAVPPSSQPRWGSTAPTVELLHGSNRARRHNPAPTSTTDPLWELSSFSEAEKAVGQSTKLPAVPPPSQPRWGSTAPTVELRHGSNRARRHNPTLTSTADPLWELSSFSEAAKAVGQPMKLPAVPPPSQPPQDATGPPSAVDRYDQQYPEPPGP